MKELSLQRCLNQLLDLGNRNPLVNFHKGMRTATLIYPESDKAFNNFRKTDKISILNLDEFYTYSYDRNGHKRLTLNQDMLNSELANHPRNTLCFTPNGQLKFRQAFRSIMSAADDALNERGIHILYVAFGFLKYRDIDTEQFFEAPLLLVPVILEKDENRYLIHAFEDDGAQVNITLDILLKNNYQMRLPEYLDTDSYTSYLQKVTDKFINFKGFSVIDSVQIGLFSFAKIDMYTDLKENEEEVLKNPIINNLFHPENSKYIPIPSDEKVAEIEPLLHSVVDADSSQMKAIALAKDGQSFVLEGPPGTGKSQTITNIIAESLYDGKSVLFVSEKLAALNVVFEKLRRVGLSDFCLSLHGSNVNKTTFLQELERTLNLKRVEVNEKADEEIKKYENDKEKLDQYCKELHTPIGAIKMTPYELFAKQLELKDYQVLNFLFKEPLKIDRLTFESEQANIKEITHLLHEFTRHYETSPLYNLKKDPRLELVSKIDIYINKAREILSQLEGDNKLDIVAFDFFNNFTLKDVKKALSYLSFLETIEHFDQYIFKDLTGDDRKKIDTYRNLKKDSEDRHKELLDIIDDPDSQELADLLDEEESFTFFKRLTKRYRLHKKALIKHLKNKLKRKDILYLQTKHADYRKTKGAFDDSKEAIYKKLSDKANASNLDEILTNKEKASTYSFNKQYFQDSLAGIFDDNKSYLSVIKDKLNKATSLLEINTFYETNTFDASKITLKELDECIAKLRKDITKYADYTKLLTNIKQAEKDGYKDFIDQYLNTELPLDDMAISFEKTLYKQLLNYTTSKYPLLASLSRFEHDEHVARFSKEDESKFTISQAKVKEAIYDKFPTVTSGSTGFNGAFISELKKKRNLLPIRKFLNQYYTSVLRIKPCFMMSPLSVSTYLDPKMKFDLVIFDEASQVFPWDAIGSIYRAKQAIIVGDPKQMPPSSFFMSYDTSDSELGDDVLDVASYESILDFFSIYPVLSLKWHYRSKCEDLIRFSNQYFYDGTLITFPSAIKAQKDFGVDFTFIPGGRYNLQGINEKEVEAVAKQVYENYQEHPERSLGVVTFNIKAQDAVIDAVEELANKDVAFSKWLRSNKDEPFFVKNLENVQGDERDTIIISVGYCKNESGHLSMNFGPLNREGGERRLNVAITRAKFNVQVLSSIHHDDFDLSKTDAIGPKLLRDYLNFAENHILPDSLSVGDGFNSYLEKDVYNFLIANGYKVDSQVGCSGYRIDLGVKHPTYDAYVLAIECDGKTYKSAGSARDRDRLRREILEKQGWRFYRIWSNSWYYNNEKEKKLLLATVDNAIKNFKDASVPTAHAEEEKQEEVAVNEFEKAGDSIYFDLADALPEYKTCQYPPIQGDITIDLVVMAAEEIVTVEAPIMRNYLYKRMAPVLNRKVVNSTVTNAVDNAIYRSKLIKEVDDYLTIGDSTKALLRKNSDRSLSEIPLVEFANAIVLLLEKDPGQVLDGLVHAIGSALGFKRLGSSAEYRISQAVDMLVGDNIIKTDNYGHYTLIKKEKAEASGAGKADSTHASVN